MFEQLKVALVNFFQELQKNQIDFCRPGSTTFHYSKFNFLWDVANLKSWSESHSILQYCILPNPKEGVVSQFKTSSQNSKLFKERKRVYNDQIN